MTPRAMPFKQCGSNVTVLLLVILLLMLLAHIVIDMSQQHHNRVREGQTVFQRMISEAAQVRPEYISEQLLAVDTKNPDLKVKTIANETHIKVAAWVTQIDYKTYYKGHL